MSKLFKYVFAAVIVLMLSFPIFAVLKGNGEVQGEVTSSWMFGEKVRFRLSVSKQTNLSGPRLADPNNFVYNGADKMKLTEGDIVSLVYNSSDDNYIIAEKLEFVQDRPGEISQTSYLMPAAIIILIILIAMIGFTAFYLIRRK